MTQVPTPTISGLTLTMAGHPRPQPRARHIGKRVVSTANPKAKAFRTALEARAREAVVNIGGAHALNQAWAGLALRVDSLWTFPTPRRERWGQLHTHRPDRDNLEKILLDVLVKAGALGGDDSRVAAGEPVKVWGDRGSVAVTVRPMVNKPELAAAKAGEPPAPGWLQSSGGVLLAKGARNRKLPPLQ